MVVIFFFKVKLLNDIIYNNTFDQIIQITVDFNDIFLYIISKRLFDICWKRRKIVRRGKERTVFSIINCLQVE